MISDIRHRQSIRSYLDREVTKNTIETILETCRWAPSGGNLQPWRIIAVSGQKKQQLSNDLTNAFDSGLAAKRDIDYYPKTWTEPYNTRRFMCGMALYNALNIGRSDKQRRLKAWRHNYEFFGAPVGLFYFLEKNTGKGALVDLGIFLQSIMLAAHSQGLGTCAQAALADYPEIVRSHLNLSPNWSLICGMSIGYPDLSSKINNYRTVREPIDSFYQWLE